jgi:pyrimidine-nucleoside phosphorylase
VGDKVSLVLAPLWAELGACVPMISGRGLGHTGGTLDKLEAIPGFRTALQPGVLRTVLGEVGCFICGQTAALAPADRTLYALRNETCTVPSIPLITASILSKKLAEGIEELVLDVKFGSGAFMPDRPAASRLAESLVRVGEGAGLRCRSRLTDMNQPLGHTVGNALEVEEAIACLQGRGPEDLATLVCELIGHPDARAVLDSGAAWPRFERMVRAQGGDLSAPLLGGDVMEEPLLAERAGTVTRCDAYGVARAAFVLGAGRVRADQDIHPGVGVRVHHKVGARVEAGEPLATLVHAARGLTASRALLRGALVVG